MRTVYLTIFITYFQFGYSQNLWLNDDTLHSNQLGFNALFKDSNLCASWLHYDINWKITNDSLFLISLNNLTVSDCTGDVASTRDFNIEDLPYTRDQRGIFANFYTDTIMLSYGQKAKFPIEPYNENCYEFTRQIIIDSGLVVENVEYQNIDSKEKGLSIFNEFTYDSIVHILNDSIEWQNLKFRKNDSIGIPLEDIYVIKIFSNGKVQISLYDEESMKNGSYSCGNCEEWFVRRTEINRVLSKIHFQPIKTFNVPKDISVVFTIKYDLENKKVTQPLH